MGALLGLSMASEARAGFEIIAVVEDVTTPSTHTYIVPQGGANDVGNGTTTVTAGNAFDTSGSGVTITSFSGTIQLSSGTTPAQLGVTGVATVNSGNTDTYKVWLESTYSGLTGPTGSGATLSQSESGSYGLTGSVASNTQMFTSWYQMGTVSPGIPPYVPNTPPPAISPGVQSFTLAATGTGTGSGSASTPGSISIPGYSTPYTLFDVVTLTITGTGATSNAYDQVTGTATITAVPEPASLVMLLTGLPVPMVVVGMLRRRKASAKS
jgi:hypothetical protein